MFERFTQEARQVVVVAQEEARTLHHNYIGTEHILLGLMRDPDSGAARALTSAGLTLERARAQVIRMVGAGEEVTGGPIDQDRDAAVRRAHEQFRWFGLGWKVNADLPNPESFKAATQFVGPEQVGEALSCGPDVEEHLSAIKAYLDAGFDEVAIVQIGADQQGPFMDWAEGELLPALRAL